MQALPEGFCVSGTPESPRSNRSQRRTSPHLRCVRTGLRGHQRFTQSSACSQPGENFECTECRETFSKLSNLKRHLANTHSDERTHSDKRPHVCDKCGTGFKRLCYLRRHLDTVHKPAKAFECDECHAFFTRSHAVRQHKLVKHSITGPTTGDDDDADERPHVCATCGRRFKLAGSLRAHKRMHVSVRKFQCPGCHKFFSSNLLRHQRNCLRAQNAGPEKAEENPLLVDGINGEEADESSAFGEQLPARTAVDDDANFDADMDMTDDNEATASSDSDASTELFASGPPLDAREVDGEDDDATGPEHTTNNEFSQVVDEVAVDEFDVRRLGGNVTKYRNPSDSFDDEGDNADAESDGDLALNLCMSGPPMRSDPDADLAAFTFLENVFLLHVQSLEDQFQRLTLRQWMPLEVLRGAFEFLSRLDLAKAAMLCRRYRNLSSAYDTLLHVANFVVEPVARGRRFGSRDHPAWPASSTPVVLWYELGPERTPGAYWRFQTVPRALEFVALKGLLQTGVGDIPNYVWENIAKSMTTTEVGQWTIDGLRLEAVARWGKIQTPFDAVKSVRSYNIRNCPYLRL